MSALLPGALLLVQAAAGGWQDAPPLPRPVTDNAVAAVETPEGAAVFSFLGLAAGRTADDVVGWAFRWDVGGDAWVEVAPVPGPPRLAATAATVRGKVYVLGGYTVAADGSERSLADVDVYDPEEDAWSAAAAIPVPVDDAVSGVWRDSLLYLVSGWHDESNENLVQVYDASADRWASATPIPGPPVFGHAGALARDAIVYLDGVRVGGGDAGDGVEGQRRFALEASAWRGDIDPVDPMRITWHRLPDHPGPARYRAAAAAVGTRVVFVGGTDNPYNYDGIGYDGRPSEPVGGGLAYDLVSGAWTRPPGPSAPSMDHRGLVRAGGWLVLVGGMEEGPRVTDRVRRISVLEMVSGG